MKNNAEIIEAIKKGRNQEVLKSLYRELLPKVKRFIHRNGGDSDQAEDMFQEGVVAFIVAVKEGRFKEESDIGFYINAVVRNKWFDRFKKKLKEEEAVQDIYEDDRIEAPEISQEQTEMVRSLVKSIGGKCEKLMKLAVFEGLSYAEIAAQLDMASDKVVKTSVYRCRQKLKEKVLSIPGLIKRLEF